jgi:hypothetical protein
MRKSCGGEIVCPFLSRKLTNTLIRSNRRTTYNIPTSELVCPNQHILSPTLPLSSYPTPFL